MVATANNLLPEIKILNDEQLKDTLIQKIISIITNPRDPDYDCPLSEGEGMLQVYINAYPTVITEQIFLFLRTAIEGNRYGLGSQLLAAVSLTQKLFESFIVMLNDDWRSTDNYWGQLARLVKLFSRDAVTVCRERPKDAEDSLLRFKILGKFIYELLEQMGGYEGILKLNLSYGDQREITHSIIVDIFEVAVALGELDLMKLILQQVNEERRKELTADAFDFVTTAAKYGYIELVKFLVANIPLKPVNWNSKTRYFETYQDGINQAHNNSLERKLEEAFYEAAINQSEQVVEFLLNKAGGNHYRDEESICKMLSSAIFRSYVEQEKLYTKFKVIMDTLEDFKNAPVTIKRLLTFLNEQLQRQDIYPAKRTFFSNTMNELVSAFREQDPNTLSFSQLQLLRAIDKKVEDIARDHSQNRHTAPVAWLFKMNWLRKTESFKMYKGLKANPSAIKFTEPSTPTPIEIDLGNETPSPSI